MSGPCQPMSLASSEGEVVRWALMQDTVAQLVEHPTVVSVALLVEHPTSNREICGSNPSGDAPPRPR